MPIFLNIITSIMINKIVGYAGFQSYSELPYSALKPGKDKLPDDKIWENSTEDLKGSISSRR